MEIKKPTVSIGMPVYNGEKYIREALDSLLSQTYSDFELIISDNASTDSTQAICEEYASRDSRIRYVRQAENMGGLYNFQYVLDEAAGEYFMWAAHDDVFYSSHLEKLIDIHKTGQFILVASSQVHQDINSGKIFRFKKITKHLFLESPQESFVNFMCLHHWDYAKACLIYGLYRKQNMPTMTCEGNRAQDIGCDLLFLYEVISRGSIFYLEEETWLRRERFYRTETISRNKFCQLFRFFLYKIIKEVPYLDKTKTIMGIKDHILRVKEIYSKSFEITDKFNSALNHNEKEIAGLLMSFNIFREPK